MQPLLSQRCGGVECHGPFFAPGRTFRNVVGVAAPECRDGRPYVAPGDPAGSYLYDKITGSDLCSGVQMPKNAPPLAADEQQVIFDWICEDALDD